ncbi:hypothetical protein BQ8794_120020 [Mesorhizobium prunaredense]|uniref:Uncharacterized protein n=1 Tax=Mesorhizobium prunaredense TaxID=1631249 RepID=A0A1R3V0S7_9HYPH|nr:hypothetical protein BQ8794_120020 [Mesorhizobium prunaredense]
MDFETCMIFAKARIEGNRVPGVRLRAAILCLIVAMTLSTSVPLPSFAVACSSIRTAQSTMTVLSICTSLSLAAP